MDISPEQMRPVHVVSFGSRGGLALDKLLTILVIEDDRLIQGIVEDALTDGGFEAAIAASGEEAVTLLKGHKGKYPGARD